MTAVTLQEHSALRAGFDAALAAPNAQMHPQFAQILNTHAALPSLHDEMQSVADYVLARWNAKQAMRGPVIRPAVPKSRAQLLAKLQAEEVGFDPAYQWSDDHSIWAYQSGKAARINALRAQLACPPPTRFRSVSCSACGEDFGPGDNGFSDCASHAHLGPL